MYFVHDLRWFFSPCNSRILLPSSQECQVQLFLFKANYRSGQDDLAKRLSPASQKAISSVVVARIPPPTPKLFICYINLRWRYYIHGCKTSGCEESVWSIFRHWVDPAQRNGTLHFLSIYLLLVIPKRWKKNPSTLSLYKRHSNLWIHNGKQHSYDAERLLINW